MWFKSKVPIKLPSVRWCAAYMPGSWLRKSFRQSALLPCLLALQGVWKPHTRNVGAEMAASDHRCLSHEKSSSTSPLQTVHFRPGETSDTIFWPGAEGLEEHRGLWEKRGWWRNKQKNAVSILGGLEAQVWCAGRKDAENNVFWISILCPLYGSSLMTWCLWLLITASSTFLHISCSPVLTEDLWLFPTPPNRCLAKRIRVLGLVWSYLYVEKSAR